MSTVHESNQNAQLVTISAPETPAPQPWTRDQIDLIKATVAKGTTDDEFALFLYVCKTTGLDPLAKQIYAIKRGGAMTMQVGIDGYRLIAARTNAHIGTDDAIFDSEDSDKPRKATTTVYRLVQGHRAPYTATARWEEYAQANNPSWHKMPYLMLAKCSEALALRKAFPAELSGLYTHEEMMQADTPPLDDRPLVTRPQPQIQTPPQAQTPTTTDEKPITKGQLDIILLSQKRAGVSNEDFKAYALPRYKIATLKDLKQKDVQSVLEWFERQLALKTPTHIDPDQLELLTQACADSGVSEAQLTDYLTQTYKITSPAELSPEQCEAVLSWVSSRQQQ